MYLYGVIIVCVCVCVSVCWVGYFTATFVHMVG